MGMFSSIIDRIFHHASGNAAAAGASTAQPSGQRPSTAAAAPAPSSSGAPAASSPKLENVDVQAVLTQAAAKKGGGGNWQTSIVDLLKLLDLDSSLSARKDLANELNVHAGADGSAEQNIALQKAVMAKIAENGGKVPDSLRH
jgi:3-oxoacyl-ACP reductase-like protein